MTATLNNLNLLTCTIQEPRIGVWSAVVDVDSDSAISGKVTLTVDGTSWVGTIVKGDLYAGRFHAQIVGGAGKLATVLDAKYYLGVSLQVVLDDLMIGSGEVLSSTTATSIRSHSVARWSRFKGKTSVALAKVADEMSLTWRVLRDGTIWLGGEQWAVAKPQYDETQRVPGRDSVTIAPETPIVAPGYTFLDKRVSRVTTSIKDDDGLRQEILYESSTGGSRVAEDLNALIDQRVESPIDYSRLYPCKVLAQAGDGSLELLPDAEKLRGNGLTRVPIRHGLPGIRVTVPAGGKVLLFFEAGDPKLPSCALWPDGSSVTQVTYTGKLVVDGDIECTGEITAKSDSAPVTVSGHKHPSATGPTGQPTPGT